MSSLSSAILRPDPLIDDEEQTHRGGSCSQLLGNVSPSIAERRVESRAELVGDSRREGLTISSHDQRSSLI